MSVLTTSRANAPTIDIVRRRDDLQRLLPSWSALRHDATTVVPDAEPERFGDILDVLGGAVEPRVTLLSSPAGPRAVIAGRLERRRPMLRLGYLQLGGLPLRCLDIPCGGIIIGNAAPGTTIDDVIERLLQMLHTESLDLITLDRMPVDDPLAIALRRHPSTRRRIAAGPIERHWQLDLRGGADAVLARLSRKHRYNLRRTDRLFTERGGGSAGLQCVTDPTGLERFLEDAFAITERSYQHALGAGLTDRRLWTALLQRDARSGRFLGYCLRAGDRPVAFQAGIVRERTFHLLATAFDPAYATHSPGQVLLVRVLDDLDRRGFDCLDYGFGDAVYKRQLGSRHWREQTMLLYGDRPAAHVMRLAQRATFAVSATARGAMARSGLLDRARRAWRWRLAGRIESEKKR